MSTEESAREPRDPSIGTLIADTSRTISSLIQKEIELAKAELRVTLFRGGFGLAFIALGIFLAFIVPVLLSFAAAYMINWNGSGLDLQWAFLIVTGFWLLLAVACVIVGIAMVKKVRAPERAIRQAAAIPSALKGQHGTATPTEHDHQH